ncbi:alpha/beta hydrolase [Asticcacaulis sp. AND118]|uniref:alpha/beta hydrolase n=1 Tax=Asticcacaulis sp. AND118 TaxID=2840468 RepID=UPI001D0013A8|nr:alpha/beta hydrolase [Asticcacaulis sp. AND118]UDF02390.1 alpha/beta hydrolase [Asticcacaulis sp. AND118]
MPANRLPLPVLSRRLFMAGAAAGIGLAGCTREDGPDQPGAAFIDSQIPPGLSPDAYPPAGFVWSGFKHGTLPEARYGVAAPPLNPRAHLLILADARYPAEVYFALARQAVEDHLSVWILEAPGQGGSGKYLLQNQDIVLPDFRHPIKTAEAFVTQTIRPSPAKPLYIFGHGSGALTALALDTRPWPLKAVLAYAPWDASQSASPEEWHREDDPTDAWARAAHRWRMANPDLRRVHLSEGWLKQMVEARKALGGFRLELGRASPPLILAGEGDLKPLCDGRHSCEVKPVAGEGELTPVFQAFLSIDV